MNRFRLKRRHIVDQYNEAFKEIDSFQTPFEEDFCDSNFHLYVLLFDFDQIGMSRGQAYDKA